MQMAPKKSGWKVMTNSVDASRFGQQKVSSLGDAIMDCVKKCATVSGEEKKEKFIHLVDGMRSVKSRVESSCASI